MVVNIVTVVLRPWCLCVIIPSGRRETSQQVKSQADRFSGARTDRRGSVKSRTTPRKNCPGDLALVVTLRRLRVQLRRALTDRSPSSRCPRAPMLSTIVSRGTLSPSSAVCRKSFTLCRPPDTVHSCCRCRRRRSATPTMIVTRRHSHVNQNA